MEWKQFARWIVVFNVKTTVNHYYFNKIIISNRVHWYSTHIILLRQISYKINLKNNNITIFGIQRKIHEQI